MGWGGEYVEVWDVGGVSVYAWGLGLFGFFNLCWIDTLNSVRGVRSVVYHALKQTPRFYALLGCCFLHLVHEELERNLLGRNPTNYLDLKCTDEPAWSTI